MFPNRKFDISIDEKKLDKVNKPSTLQQAMITYSRKIICKI